MDEPDYDGEQIPSYPDGFTTVSGFNHELVRRRYEAAKEYMHGKIIELGPADGGMSQMLERDFTTAMVTVWHDKVEDFLDVRPCTKFDTVLAMHIAEHVEDDEKFFADCFRLTKKGGTCIVSVPNGMSMHRRAGVIRGDIDNEFDLGPRDIQAGHVRVYSSYDLHVKLMEAGFEFDRRLPILVKPFPDHLMEELTGEMLQILADATAQSPQLDSQIVFVLQKPL